MNIKGVFLAAILAAVLCLNGTLLAYSGGTGEPNNPYHIATKDDLLELAATPADYNDCFILTADINLAGQTFTHAPIAPDTSPSGELRGTPFTGVFDGNSHVISNLTITASAKDYIGLFGFVGSGGQIKNLGVEDPNITGYYVGGLVGCNSGSVTSCYATGTVSGSSGVGGLVGYNYRGSVTSCYATGTVSGTWDVGGLVGYNYRGTVTSCYATGTVSGNGYFVGGLVGYNSGNVSSCYAAGAVTGTYDVGGLVGYNSSYGSLTACYATGNVSGIENVGGLMGENFYGSVTSCYATGMVSGTGDLVGGLVGINVGSVTTCYATGAVSGDEYVGGLVGENYGPVTSCYATGTVSGTGSYVGGLVGSGSSSSITSSFWDTDTSGRTTSAGGTGMTTAQMQNISTFLAAGWDFINETANGTCNYWQMPQGGYPVLSIFTGYIPPEPLGSGTEDDPYIIADANDLGTIWYRPSAYYALANDIDLTGISWSMAVVPLFSGVLDGNEFCIRNLSIAGGGYLGLFGRINSGGSVKNLGLEDCTVSGTRYYVGGLVGENYEGSVTSCYATGAVSGNGYVGGLVGSNYYGGVTSCYATGAVSGYQYAGGLVGYNYYGSVTSCYSTGVVSSTGNSVGGLVGYNSYGSVTSSYAAGAVSGSYYVGGLVGYNYQGKIIRCYSTGRPTGTSSVGGLCGYKTTGGNYQDTGNFWDKQTSQTATSTMGMGKTTIQMKTLLTFTLAGWDFSDADGDPADWMMLRPGEDYPRLAWHEVFAGDIAGLYGVDGIDLEELTSHWLQSGCPLDCEDADIDKSGYVDFSDFAMLAANWLKGVTP